MTTTACGTRVWETRLHPGATYAPVPVDSVRVFATQAPAVYTEIAVLSAGGGFPYTSAKGIRAMRERAGRLGANGLLLLDTRAPAPATTDISGVVIGGPANGSVIVGQADGPSTELYRAVAIRYDAAAPLVAPGGAAKGAGPRR